MVAKYIIILSRGQHLPIVWPNPGSLAHTLEHKAVADALTREGGALLVSAGSCLPCDGWRCFGQSMSLGLHSRGAEDTAILQRHFDPQGRMTLSATERRAVDQESSGPGVTFRTQPAD